VARSIDAGIRRTEPVVDLDAPLVELHARELQVQLLNIGCSPDPHQNFIAGYVFLASATVDNHRFQAVGAINPQDAGSEDKLNALLLEATLQEIRSFRVFARQEP